MSEIIIRNATLRPRARQPASPVCVAVTGGIGSGKSTVTELLHQAGAPLIDLDAISRQLTAVGGAAMDDIAQAFGVECICADGSLNRAVMRAWVFDNPSAKAQLEAILHPLIRQAAQAQIQASQAPWLIVDIPLLAHSPEWQALVDYVVWVRAEPATQIARVMQRPAQMSAKQITAIIAQQPSHDELWQIADSVLENNGDCRLHLCTQVNILNDHIRHLCV